MPMQRLRNRIADGIPWLLGLKVVIAGGWQVHKLQVDVKDQSNTLQEHCVKMRQIQDTLTSGSLTDSERTSEIEKLVSQCLLEEEQGEESRH